MSPFTIQALNGTSVVAAWHRDTEQAAMCEALDHVGPRTPHVALTGRDPSKSIDTFALRHLTMQPDGSINDTGWRAWVDGQFVGPVAAWPLVDAEVAA